ncbi:MAG: hypothetical protein ACI9N1_000729 [Flavobacteriales bacterium]|jgi:hypothetical protein
MMKGRYTHLIFLIAAIAVLATGCKCKKDATKEADKNGTEKAASGAMIPSVIVTDGFVAPEKNHAFTVNSAKMDGHILYVEVSYSGGCEEHKFELHTNRMFMKSMPPKLGVFLKHDNGGDNCEAIETKTLQFDMQAAQYPTEQEDFKLIFLLNNWKDGIEYVY